MDIKEYIWNPRGSNFTFFPPPLSESRNMSLTGSRDFSVLSSHFIVTYLPIYYYCIATLSWNVPNFQYLLFLIAKFSILTLIWGHKTHTNLSLSKNIQYKERQTWEGCFFTLFPESSLCQWWSPWDSQSESGCPLARLSWEGDRPAHPPQNAWLHAGWQLPTG